MSTSLASTGLFHKSQPFAADRFREKTANHAKLAGVTIPTFMCRCCGKRKLAEGRKRINPKYPRDGFKCADCAASHA